MSKQLLAIGALALACSAQAQTQAVAWSSIQGPVQSFESLVVSDPLGSLIDGLLVLGNLQFGERFAGQELATAILPRPGSPLEQDRFDDLGFGLPSAGLSLLAGSAGANLGVYDYGDAGGKALASSGSISAAPTADGLAYQFDFSSSGEVLYALQGGSFIAAMNSIVAPPSSSTDNPLASGLGFIQNLNYGPAHGGSGDGAVQRTEWYVGPTTGLTADAYKAAIADMRNWDKDTGTSAFKALILLEGGLVPMVSGGDALGRGAGNFDIVSSPVPEPTSALLLGGGLLAIALKRRRG
ncbi:MAG: PEP-CTERM sorting domain-containing protein [Inhella sp.]